ncbi:MAG: hypothetical protein WCO00_00620 [Rhodospirillaceae bacterium]
MKWFARAALFTVFALSSTAALADMDSMQWIAQCMKDNASATVSADVVSKYCACMNSRMDNNESMTITQWEAANPAVRKECESASGWK